MAVEIRTKFLKQLKPKYLIKTEFKLHRPQKAFNIRLCIHFFLIDWFIVYSSHRTRVVWMKFVKDIYLKADVDMLEICCAVAPQAKSPICCRWLPVIAEMLLLMYFFSQEEKPDFNCQKWGKKKSMHKLNFSLRKKKKTFSHDSQVIIEYHKSN